MAWTDALDAMISTVRDTFPASVAYTPEGSPTTYSLTGVYDEAYKGTELDRNYGVPVETTRPVLTIRLADLPVGTQPHVRDVLTVNSTTYEVSNVQPDGSGMSRLYLVEVV